MAITQCRSLAWLLPRLRLFLLISQQLRSELLKSKKGEPSGKSWTAWLLISFMLALIFCYWSTQLTAPKYGCVYASSKTWMHTATAAYHGKVAHGRWQLLPQRCRTALVEFRYVSTCDWFASNIGLHRFCAILWSTLPPPLETSAHQACSHNHFRNISSSEHMGSVTATEYGGH